MEGLEYFQNLLDSNQPLTVSQTISAMGVLNGQENWEILKEIAYDSSRPLTVRRQAIGSMGRGWEEEDWLMQAFTAGEIPEELENAAAAALMKSYKPGIRNKLPELIGQDRGGTLSVQQLVARSGDPQIGQRVI